MLQRLTKILAQVKAGNAFENLLNEVKQTIYPLFVIKTEWILHSWK